MACARNILIELEANHESIASVGRGQGGENMRNNNALRKWELLRASVRKPPVSVGVEQEATA